MCTFRSGFSIVYALCQGCADITNTLTTSHLLVHDIVCKYMYIVSTYTVELLCINQDTLVTKGSVLVCELSWFVPDLTGWNIYRVFEATISAHFMKVSLLQGVLFRDVLLC